MAQNDLPLIQLVEEQDEAVVRSSDWIERLQASINYLIANDFSGLVQVLYRADVSEKKLKLLLAEFTSTDAAAIIARLIVERQLQKIESRKNFAANRFEDGGEERW